MIRRKFWKPLLLEVSQRRSRWTSQEVTGVVWKIDGVGSDQCGVDKVKRYKSRW